MATPPSSPPISAGAGVEAWSLVDNDQLEMSLEVELNSRKKRKKAKEIDSRMNSDFTTLYFLILFVSFGQS